MKWVYDVRKQIVVASDNATRNTERIERSESIVEQNTRTIIECRELIRQCQDDNRRAERILRDIAQRNKEPATTCQDKSN